MSLRDQLKKAKLLSEQDARRLAHEARVERTEKGRDEIEREQRQKEQELKQLQGEERARTVKEQKELDAARAQRDEEAAVAAILENEAARPGPGAVKWYFPAEDGSLPWLEVSPREAQELTSGTVSVVLHGPAGTHEYRLLRTDLARRVARSRPEVIVHAPRGVLG